MNTLIWNDGNIIDVYENLMQRRVIFAHGFINDNVASDIVATLFFLDKINQEKITLLINSDGGDIRSIMMIYDAMNLLQSPIETICVGVAMHESILLLAAGTKGMRYCTPNSILAISSLKANDIMYSDLSDAKISNDLFKKEHSIFVKALSESTGISESVLVKDTSNTLFLVPLESKRYNLIDHIITLEKNNAVRKKRTTKTKSKQKPKSAKKPKR